SGAGKIWARVVASIEANSYSTPAPDGVDETWIDFMTGAPMAARCPDAIAVPVPETDYYPRAFGCNGETGFGARIRSWLDSSRR
ncbi:MAG TPA: hypothetical protein VF405_07180, partial [Gammaproteobacteria bacterium]